MARDPKAPKVKEQTDEDIAREEAEREKVMQAEMITAVTEAVMKNMESHYWLLLTRSNASRKLLTSPHITTTITLIITAPRTITITIRMPMIIITPMTRKPQQG